TGWLHYVLYAGMIFFFSYFWVAMVFNPIQIADDMKRHGGFIPGVRPGETTAQFLDYSMTRLTFAGAIFLTALAVLPMLVQNLMGVPRLIIVGVMLDTMRQAETYLLQRHYDGFLKKGRIKGRTVAGTGATSNAISESQIAWLLVIIAIIALGGILVSLR
ncbi:MAG: preprotein translocase subunit SecY, partial [Verrucomicrobia bacterium]|nr:preprotein translocase subunit SecY [Verrucomicrobiota bacterium]